MTRTCLRCNSAPRGVGSSFCDSCASDVRAGKPLVARVDGREQAVRLPQERPKPPSKPPVVREPKGSWRRASTSIRGTCCLPDEDWCEGCAANYLAFHNWLMAHPLRGAFLVIRV